MTEAQFEQAEADQLAEDMGLLDPDQPTKTATERHLRKIRKEASHDH